MPQFDQGEDYVAARLSIDIPDGSVQGIREITQEVERYRVALEAATRAEADISRYLGQMGEAAKRAAEAQAHLTQELRTYISLSGRAGGAPSSSVPLGGSQSPFTNAGEAGMGTDRIPAQLNMAQQQSPREWLNMQHSRGAVTAQDAISITPQSIHDLANKISEREQAKQEQAKVTDHNQQTGSGRGDGMDYDRVQQKVHQATSLAGRVMNEVGPRGSVAGAGKLILQGIDYARRRHSMQAPGRSPESQTSEGVDGGDLTGVQLPPAGAPGTGSDPAAASPASEAEDAAKAGSGAGRGGGLLGGLLGSTAGKLGAAGALISGLVGGYQLVQKGGEMVQGMRNVASLRGGAAGQGAEVEVRAKMMAMNPFVTQDQARQIYQTVMSEGYADAAGGGADNVVDFMRDNMTKMNISVADSAKMLRDTIIGSGEGDKKGVAQAVGELSKSLDTIRTLSQQGVMSQPEFRAGVLGTKHALMNMGGTPEQAMQSALTAETVESGDQALKGQFAGAAQGFATEQGGVWLRAYGGPGGTPLRSVDPRLFPQVTAQALQEQGGDAYNQAVENALRSDVRMAGATGPEENRVYLFQQRLRAQGLNIEATQSLDAAKTLYEDVQSGKQGDALKQAERQVSEAGGDTTGVGRARGGSNQLSGNVTIDLTPAAAKLLQVQGGNSISLTKTQIAANRGIGDAQVNNDPDSMS